MRCPLCDKVVGSMMGHLTFGHSQWQLADYIVNGKKSTADYGIFESSRTVADRDLP